MTGGEVTKQRYGIAFLRRIGRKGGEQTAKRGAGYYAEIGRKGGRANKGGAKPGAGRRRP